MDMQKLQDTANEILQKALDTATQGADFLKDQLPDVVQQLLRWKALENGCWALFEYVAFAAVVWGAIRFYKAMCPTGLKDLEFEVGVVMLGMAIVAGLFVGAANSNFFNFLEIVIAPKVYLLEYAASLVHK